MAAGSPGANEGRNALTPISRPRKRVHPLVFSGLECSYEDKNNDFLCPICFNIIHEACMTRCGHSFCRDCVAKIVDHNTRCPKCNMLMSSKDEVFPNFHLNELILKYKQNLEHKKAKLQKLSSVSPEFQEMIISQSDKLDLPDVNLLLDILLEKKQQLEMESSAVQHQLLLEFLQQVQKHKQMQLNELTREISIVNDDTKKINELVQNHKLNRSFNATNSSSDATSSSKDHVPSTSTNEVEASVNGTSAREHLATYLSSLATKRKNLNLHFDDLEDCYLKARCAQVEFGESEQDKSNGLTEFKRSLSMFTRFSNVRTIATLSYATDQINGSSIVSSIEFDKDNEFFAMAGVTKKIKLYEYATVIKDSIDLHYPIGEMLCNSKISCVSWNAFDKGMLASSDYEGTVTLWDAFTGKKHMVFQEHEKRCWSVDFNRVDTKLIASGSDDSRVKLWSTNMEHSVANLEAKANVCCVKFNPNSHHYLAFGSADHSVHYYDLRHAKQALGVFKGHRKAVSYAKFLNSEQLVSASTDSQLKLWNVNKMQCVKSFRGHTNEKNFVGLATDGEYIACGSENNSLYVYYKGFSKHLQSYRFDTLRSVVEKDRKEEECNEFVSAVCWRQGSNIVVAANSQGSIKILEMV